MISEKSETKLIMEAVKRPPIILKVLKEYLASTGPSLHVKTLIFLTCLGYWIGWLDSSFS